MAERKEYTMSREDFDSMLQKINDARKTSGMFISGGTPLSDPQATANACWAELGKKMGFKGNTARPHWSADPLKFTAEPVDAEEPRT